MKTQVGLLQRLGWLFTFSVVVLPALTALAQDEYDRFSSLSGVAIFCIFLVAVAFYVYHALAVQTIATKTNTENPWLAWIPIANIILLLNIAKKPLWWIILFIIPLANIVVAIMVWIEIAKARRKPEWWGFMVLVPIMNVIMPGYLAWAD